MKKYVTILRYSLIALLFLLPLGTGISAIFKCSFEFTYCSVFAVATMIVAVVTLSTINKVPLSKFQQVLFAFLPLLSIINIVFYLFKYNRISIVERLITFISLMVCEVLCFIISMEYTKPRALKIISSVLSTLLLLPACLLMFMSLAMGDFGEVTVTQTVYSPNEEYYAQVICYDQGALGGDTTVKLCKNKEFNVLLFKIYPTPHEVYFGDWHEYKNIDVHFKDNHTFIVNSNVYTIK